MRSLAVVTLAFLLSFEVFAATTETTVLDVQNMTCNMCSVTVKKALTRVPGVADVKVDFDKKIATVKFDPDRATTAALIKATTDAGYPSGVRESR